MVRKIKRIIKVIKRGLITYAVISIGNYIIKVKAKAGGIIEIKLPSFTGHHTQVVHQGVSHGGGGSLLGLIIGLLCIVVFAVLINKQKKTEDKGPKVNIGSRKVSIKKS